MKEVGEVAMATHISIQDLIKVYPSSDGTVRALDRVSLSVERGSFTTIVGPSGCGKSTLLAIIAGLLSKSSGSVSVDGQEVVRPLTDIGIVFQSPVLLDWRTALENVLLQIEARRGDRETGEVRARDLLTKAGLAGFEKKYPWELSGGMSQRVALCRALVHNPPLLLMDEPFGALDAITRDQMMVDLQQLWHEGQKTVVFITHSVPEAVFLSDDIVVMSPRPGRIDHRLHVDLPRPRTFRDREKPEFVEYVKQIMDVFLSRGVIRGNIGDRESMVEEPRS